MRFFAEIPNRVRIFLGLIFLIAALYALRNDDDVIPTLLTSPASCEMH